MHILKESSQAGQLIPKESPVFNLPMVYLLMSIALTSM